MRNMKDRTVHMLITMVIIVTAAVTALSATPIHAGTDSKLKVAAEDGAGPGMLNDYGAQYKAKLKDKLRVKDAQEKPEPVPQQQETLGTAKPELQSPAAAVQPPTSPDNTPQAE